MTNDKSIKFDLEERTAKFGEAVILFLKTIQKNEITRPLVGQLVRSTSFAGGGLSAAGHAFAAALTAEQSRPSAAEASSA